MMSRRFLGVCAALAVVAAAGCSGGGSAGAPNVIPSPPNHTQSYGNALTSYTVFVGNIGTDSVVDVVPIGTTSAVPGAAIAKSASILYPDGSVQTPDTLANFDASQSSWAAANLSALVLNPAMQPLVDAAVNVSSGVVPLPEEIAVAAYAPGGGTVALDGQIQSGTSAVPELATIAMVPKSSWLQDGHARLYTVLGKDTNNGAFPLNKSQVKWTVTRAAGCGAAAGTILPLPSDSSKAIYKAPASGSTSSSCPDQIVASVGTANQFAGSATAYSFDPRAGAKLAGVLQDATGKPLPNALIDLYAGSSDAAQGTLLIATDAQGKFSRTVPASRIITPIVASISAGHASYKNVTPASINPVTAGAALASQTWKLASNAQSMKQTQPDFSSILHDASYYSGLMRQQLPLDTPNAQGAFPAGSIEAILAAPVANGTGHVTTGTYRNYSYAWNAGANVATFTQSAPTSEQRVLTVTIHAANVGSTACAPGANCFSYNMKYGGQLETDGAWSQQVSAGKYNLLYIANRYNSSHQVAGAPLYIDTTQASQTLGATGSLTFVQAHANAANKQLASISATRTLAASPVLFNYTGSVKAYAYSANGAAVEVDYTLSNGIENDNGSGSFNLLVAHTAASADAGVSVNWKNNDSSTAAAQNQRANGTIDVPGAMNLASGHEASFTSDGHNLVHVTLDSSLGGNVLTFQL